MAELELMTLRVINAILPYFLDVRSSPYRVANSDRSALPARGANSVQSNDNVIKLANGAMT
jgi:hypothetical protein